MIPAEIIRKKRDAEALSSEEIEFFLGGATSGSIDDAQLGAFLMACVIRGLNYEETAFMTTAMRDSGLTFDFSYAGKRIVDKHSTGGVGDKTSIAILPILVECGAIVPMISGRGLGHTGGTVDKLESIPGMNMNLNFAQSKKMIDEYGGFFARQTAAIAPADRKLYHTRDVTATIESAGLIAASIMSKKLAEGLDGLVIDMKVGAGAFMKDIKSAKELAKYMRSVAESFGVKLTVVYSNMDRPLGASVGNYCEFVEARRFLEGESQTDFRVICETLCVEALLVSGLSENQNAASEKVRDVVKSGGALRTLKKIIEAQGGDLNKADEYMKSVESTFLRSPKSGVLNSIDAREIGIAAIELGAGRKRENDEIDPYAGIRFLKNVGEKVSADENLVEIFGRNGFTFLTAGERILNACSIDDEPFKRTSEIIEVERPD